MRRIETLLTATVALLVLYLGSFYMFKSKHFTAGPAAPGSITTLCWRVDDTSQNRALMKLYWPLLKLPPFDVRIEWY